MTEERKRIPEPLKSGVISIDSYDEKCFKGQVFYPVLGKQFKFSGAMQMLDAIDSAVRALGYAGEFCERRRFFPPTGEGIRGASDMEVAKPPKGALATFAVKVVFMQNASWQGTLLWQEAGEEQSFRSVLELLGLMDSALTGR